MHWHLAWGEFDAAQLHWEALGRPKLGAKKKR